MSPMNRFAYLLILILLSTQIDDAWAAAPVFQSASVASDSDEYLPAKRRLRDEESSSQELLFVGLKTRTPGFPPARSGLSVESNLSTPFPATSLYVFMSLQI